MFGLDDLTDVVTENSWLIAESSVRFELYYGGNGKPRAYNVKMLVMTFGSACVKSYNPTSHYGSLACDGLDEDVWFAEAAFARAKDSGVLQVEGPSRTVDPAPGTPVQADMFQRGYGQLRAFRVSPH